MLLKSGQYNDSTHLETSAKAFEESIFTTCSSSFKEYKKRIDKKMNKIILQFTNSKTEVVQVITQLNNIEVIHYWNSTFASLLSQPMLTSELQLARTAGIDISNTIQCICDLYHFIFRIKLPYAVFAYQVPESYKHFSAIIAAPQQTLLRQYLDQLTPLLLQVRQILHYPHSGANSSSDAGTGTLTGQGNQCALSFLCSTLAPLVVKLIELIDVNTLTPAVGTDTAVAAAAVTASIANHATDKASVTLNGIRDINEFQRQHVPFFSFLQSLGCFGALKTVVTVTTATQNPHQLHQGGRMVQVKCVAEMHFILHAFDLLIHFSPPLRCDDMTHSVNVRQCSLSLAISSQPPQSSHSCKDGGGGEDSSVPPEVLSARSRDLELTLLQHLHSLAYTQEQGLGHTFIPTHVLFELMNHFYEKVGHVQQ